jgi:uncharacterized membrane protein
MKRFSGVQCLLCLALLAGVLVIFSGSHAALATQESSSPSIQLPPNEEEAPPEEPAEEPVEEKLELTSRFPVKQGQSGTSFEFEVDLSYQGNEPKLFEFTLNPPPGWDISVKRYFSSDEPQATILAMTLEPDQTYPDTVIVTLSPLPGNLPGPGDYILTFEAASDNLKDSIELKAVVTNLPLTYEISFATTSGRLDFPVKPGEENPILLKVTNSGGGVVTNLSFTSVKSEGWGTTFSPNMTESLEPGQSVEAEMMMTPPQNTIAGDYRILIRVGADSPDMRLQEQVDLRIRVQTPTVWGAAGIGIVVAVIAALAIMFRRLGRR